MRKLATVRKISEILPIEGADSIEVAVVDGWKVVVKKGEYNVGDLAVYLEVDSWVPNELAPFLTSTGKEPKEFEGIKGERLRTVKLRKQISQGLLLPVSVLLNLWSGSRFDEGEEVSELLQEGNDVTEILGILKWEKPISANLRGQVRGNFPSLIPKTDQERIQNLKKEFNTEFRNHTWEVTEKLHGSSCTFYLDMDDVFHVCSRNLDLKFNENNAYWKAAIKYNVEQMMLDLKMQGIAVQGELIGPGINGNQYGLTDIEFYVFDIYSTNVEGYLDAASRACFTDELCLKHTPVLEVNAVITENNLDHFIAYADGKSKLNASNREGLVWKSMQDPNISFKVVSNKWLLDGGEDQ